MSWLVQLGLGTLGFFALLIIVPLVVILIIAGIGGVAKIFTSKTTWKIIGYIVGAISLYCIISCLPNVAARIGAIVLITIAIIIFSAYLDKKIDGKKKATKATEKTDSRK